MLLIVGDCVFVVWGFFSGFGGCFVLFFLGESWHVLLFFLRKYDISEFLDGGRITRRQ